MHNYKNTYGVHTFKIVTTSYCTRDLGLATFCNVFVLAIRRIKSYNHHNMSLSFRSPVATDEIPSVVDSFNFIKNITSSTVAKVYGISSTTIHQLMYPQRYLRYKFRIICMSNKKDT